MVATFVSLPFKNLSMITKETRELTPEFKEWLKDEGYSIDANRKVVDEVGKDHNLKLLMWMHSRFGLTEENEEFKHKN